MTADIDDLRSKIFDMKKQNSEIKSENHLLKVKVRRLSDQVCKKDKQIATLLNPSKGETVRKLLTQQGAALIMSLRDENLKLHKQLSEKEAHLRRLQNDLQMYKLYTEKTKLNMISNMFIDTPEKVLKIDTLSEGTSHATLSAPRITRSQSKSVITQMRACSVSPHRKSSPQGKCLSRKESKSVTDLERSYMTLLSNNIKTIKESSIKKVDKSCQENMSPSPCLSPPNNTPQSNSPTDLPHIEILQLQKYFMNILNELDYLKERVQQLQAEQKTSSSKDLCKNVEIADCKKLAEIKELNKKILEKYVTLCSKTTNVESNASLDEMSSNIKVHPVTQCTKCTNVESNVSLDEYSISSENNMQVNTPINSETRSASVQTTNLFM